MGWSKKYKRSIDCSNPKGFSQKAHCDGRKKRKKGGKTKSKSINEMNKLNELQHILYNIITEGVDDPGILKCVFMAGGPGCFVEGTLVRTENGYIPINNISSGDMVYTINEDTGEEELKQVLLTHEYTEHPEDLLELEFEDGTIVRCTENHRFYVDGEWIPAKDLQVE